MNFSYEDRQQIEPDAVSMHGAFKRDGNLRDSEVIFYPSLDNHIEAARVREYSFLRLFFESPEGSVDAEKWARRAATAYLIRTGEQLRTGHNDQKVLSSERFTQASIELYGKPEKEEVKRLLGTQLKEFEALIGNNSVDQAKLESQIKYLRLQLGGAEIIESDMVGVKETLSQFREVINNRYGKELALFEFPAKSATEKIPVEEVQALFQEGIDLLAESDLAWREVKAKTTKDSAMDYNSRTKIVGVGCMAREAGRLKGSFIHEVLAHALSSINGSKTNDELLEHGMPGAKDAIDGIAVFFAAAERGRITDRPKDFYMDIAFALGQLGQPKLSRPELQKLYLDRSIVRKQAAGEKVNEDSLGRKAWSYVNRIYRGTLGNEIIGVNTFDIAYYQGFIKIVRFVQQQLSAGKSAEEIFDYLTSGMFDPTNQDHVEYQRKIYSKGVGIKNE